jgi:hypothetical protein
MEKKYMQITKKDFNIALVVFFIIGIYAGFIVFNAKYQKEIQEFRNTKTAECLVKQKKQELTVN